MKGSARAYWRWRLIDDQKCWYPGRVIVSKDQLSWGPPEVVVRRTHYSAIELEAPPPAPQAVVVPVQPQHPPVADWDPTRVEGAFSALEHRVVLPNPMIPVVRHKSAPWTDLWIIAGMFAVILVAYTLTHLVFRNLGRLS